MASIKIDMITLQVLISAFQSITDEMNMALIKTAYSTNIKDRRDCSCAVYSPGGESVAQTELGSPVHLGIMPSALDSVLEKFSLDDLEAGDHIAVNIPYPKGPGHLNDITLVSPVFIGEKVAFLVANMAHHADVGGHAPGSMALGRSTIYQEGVQIPPTKLVSRGQINRPILDFLKQNVRMGVELEGDLCAQMACNNVGVRRLTELAGRYGVSTLQDFTQYIFHYSERRMRAGLRKVPNGIYTFEDAIEGTALTPPSIPVKVRVTVEDEDIYFDFTGSSPQVRDSLNSNLACVNSACYYVVKVLVDPGLPPNVGSYRPIHIHAPVGTVVNARPPAAVANATIITSPKIVDVLLGALVPAVPERGAAASNGATSMFNIGGVDPARGAMYSYVETYAGGQGAMHSQDGMDAVQCHMTNTRNAPVEVIEATYPLLVLGYGLVQDTEGPGRFRGGLGMERDLEIQGEETVLSVSTDRYTKGPWGLFGGQPGGCSNVHTTSPEGERQRLPYSKMTFSAETGSRISLQTAGAGGWGDPFTRDPEKVLWDVIEEFISPGRAEKEYGVAVRRTGSRHYKLDLERTQELRASREKEGAGLADRPPSAVTPNR